MNHENLEALYYYAANADLANNVYPNLTDKTKEIVDLLRRIRQVFVDHNLTEQQFDLVKTETLLINMGYSETRAVSITEVLHEYLAEDCQLNFRALENIEIKAIANDVMDQGAENLR